MKRIVMIVAASALLCTSAFAGGSKNALNVGAVVATGKGGVLGTVLGSSGHGSTGVAANVNVSTGKGGVLGTVLGSNGKGSNGVGVGANVNTGKGGVLGLLTGSKTSHHGGY